MLRSQRQDQAKARSFYRAKSHSRAKPGGNGCRLGSAGTDGMAATQEAEEAVIVVVRVRLGGPHGESAGAAVGGLGHSGIDMDELTVLRADRVVALYEMKVAQGPYEGENREQEGTDSPQPFGATPSRGRRDLQPLC